MDLVEMGIRGRSAGIPGLVLGAAMLLFGPAAAGDPPLVEVRHGTVTVLHAAENAGLARDLAARADGHALRIRRDLGLGRQVPVTILLLTGRAPEQVRERYRESLPRWLAGAADAGRQFVVIRVRPGQTPRALEPLLAHELTHVIVKADFPRWAEWPAWFQEGLAMRESGGEGLERFAVLSFAALRDRLIPLERLTVRFPDNEAEARLAYAQSASFLSFLAGTYGEGRFGELLGRLREEPFEEAFRRVYGRGVGAVAGLWERWVRRRYNWIPLITGGTAFWTLILALFFLSLAARRRKDRRLRAQWEEEERFLE